MDIFTDDSYMELDLPKIDKSKNFTFVGLKTIARNANNKEIAFIETISNGDIKYLLNLNPIDMYPDAPTQYKNQYNEDFLKHIKLEIEYILTDIEIDTAVKSPWLSDTIPFIENILTLKVPLIAKIIRGIFQTKITTITMYGNIQPEFYITLPKGWNIMETKKSQDINSYIVMLQKYKNGEFYEDLQLERPFINIIDRKKKYNFIATTSYSEVEKDHKDNQIKYNFTYASILSFEIKFFTIIPFAFILMDSFFIYKAIKNHLNEVSPLTVALGTGILIAFLSYSYFYFNLGQEGYVIPLEKLYYVALFLTLVTAVLIICKSIA